MIRLNNILLILLMASGFLSISCDTKHDDLGAGKGDSNGPRGAAVPYENVKLKKLLQTTDYPFVVKFLPRLLTSIGLVVHDLAATTALGPFFDNAISLAEQMSKPHSQDITDSYNNAISELNGQIEVTLSKLPKSDHTNFELAVDSQETSARSELNLENDLARNQMANFSAAESGFLDTFITNHVQHEAFAIYFETKFRAGVKSLTILSVNSELDDVKNAVDAINSANRAGTAKPDSSIFFDARAALRTKIASMLNKKINQGQKDDVMRTYWNMSIYESIKDDVKNVVEKTKEAKDKADAVGAGSAYSVIREAVGAAEVAVRTAKNSGVDSAHYIVTEALKTAKTAYLKLANTAKTLAESAKSAAEAAKSSGDMSAVRMAALNAKGFYEAVQSVKTAEPDAAADVDAAERASNGAQQVLNEAAAAQPTNDALNDAQTAVKRVTTALVDLQIAVSKLPNVSTTAGLMTAVYMSGASSGISGVIFNANKVAKNIALAKSSITSASNKGATVTTLESDIADAETKVKEAYKSAATAAETIIDKQKAEVEKQRDIAKGASDYIDSITAPGRLINGSEKDDGEKKSIAAEAPVKLAKDAFEKAKTIAKEIQGKFTESLAAEGKTIADSAILAAVASRSAYDGAASLDDAYGESGGATLYLKNAKANYVNKVYPIAVKSWVIKPAAIKLKAAIDLHKEILKNISDITAITNHGTNTNAKGEKFVEEVTAAVTELEKLPKAITGATDAIKAVRSDAKNPVLDTDPLFPKANAEDAVPKLDATEAAKLEGDIVAKALVEANAFAAISKREKEAAEKEKDKAILPATADADVKLALTNSTVYEEVAYYASISAQNIFNSVEKLKNPSVKGSIDAIEKASKDAEADFNKVSDAVNDIQAEIKKRKI